MAPISEAIRVRPIYFDASFLPPPIDVSKETKLYSGTVDPEWTIGRLVNFNYVPAMTVDYVVNMPPDCAVLLMEVTILQFGRGQ
jgi:hypothetical protein